MYLSFFLYLEKEILISTTKGASKGFNKYDDEYNIVGQVFLSLPLMEAIKDSVLWIRHVCVCMHHQRTKADGQRCKQAESRLICVRWEQRWYATHTGSDFSVQRDRLADHTPIIWRSRSRSSRKSARLRSSNAICGAATAAGQRLPCFWMR